MTGGGSIFTLPGVGTAGGTRVTHGFEIHCDPNNVPNRLEVNWPDANNFHMLVLTNATCTYDPAVGPPNQPPAGFNTFDGIGIGKFNNLPDYKIVFRFTDAGEPGRDDIAIYKVYDPNGTLIFQSGGATDAPIKLTFGNHQAHKDNSDAANVLGVWATYSDARSYPDYWPPTGYTANTSVKSTFSRVANNPYKSLANSSLLNALSFSDGNDLVGAAQTLLRVATKALLDASHPSVVYRLSATEVLAKVNAALDSQDQGIMLQLANDLASYDALRNFQIPVVTPPKRKGN